MRAEELGMVVNDTVQRVLVAPRYCGKLVLTLEMICHAGGIRELAVSMRKIVTNEEVEKIKETS